MSFSLIKYPISGSGGGTVTSVGLTGNPIFDITNSPITVSGDINLDLVTQTANTFFAGPASGADAIPTFRALVASDIPVPIVNNGLSVNNSSIGWGQPIGEPGSPAMLLEDREIPLNNFHLNILTSIGGVVSFGEEGFANNPSLHCNTFMTFLADQNIFVFQTTDPSPNGGPQLQLASTPDGTNTNAGTIVGFDFTQNPTDTLGRPLVITTEGFGSAIQVTGGDIIIIPGTTQGSNHRVHGLGDWSIIMDPCGAGFIQMINLAGTGTRMVVADPTGILSAQAFPNLDEVLTSGNVSSSNISLLSTAGAFTDIDVQNTIGSSRIRAIGSISGSNPQAAIMCDADRPVLDLMATTGQVAYINVRDTSDTAVDLHISHSDPNGGLTGTNIIFADGRVSGADAINPNEFITLQQLDAKVISNSFSQAVTAINTVTVTIGSTLANNGYRVNVTSSNLLSSVPFFVNAKTTTTFNVVFTGTPLTGTIAFDWALFQ